MKFFLLKTFIILLLILFSNNAYAGIDQSINDFLAPISQIISNEGRKKCCKITQKSSLRDPKIIILDILVKFIN